MKKVTEVELSDLADDYIEKYGMEKSENYHNHLECVFYDIFRNEDGGSPQKFTKDLLEDLIHDYTENEMEEGVKPYRFLLEFMEENKIEVLTADL